MSHDSDDAYVEKRFSWSSVETVRVERPPRGNNITAIILSYTNYCSGTVGGFFSFFGCLRGRRAFLHVAAPTYYV